MRDCLGEADEKALRYHHPYRRRESAETLSNPLVSQTFPTPLGLQTAFPRRTSVDATPLLGVVISADPSDANGGPSAVWGGGNKTSRGAGPGEHVMQAAAGYTLSFTVSGIVSVWFQGVVVPEVIAMSNLVDSRPPEEMASADGSVATPIARVRAWRFHNSTLTASQTHLWHQLDPTALHSTPRSHWLCIALR